MPRPVDASKSIYGDTLYKPLKDYSPEEEALLRQIGESWTMKEKVYDLARNSAGKTKSKWKELSGIKSLREQGEDSIMLPRTN